jgi:hypothetical protein
VTAIVTSRVLRAVLTNPHLSDQSALERPPDLPAMPERVHDRAVTPSVVAVLHGLPNDCACNNSPIEQRIGVIYDELQPHRRPTEQLW